MDLSKLTPAPWEARGGYVYRNPSEPRNANGFLVDGLSKRDDAQFIALARNAFDVMMRRGWTAEKIGEDGWRVMGAYSEGRSFTGKTVGWAKHCAGHADPFTALVEADKWYRENVEKPPS